jgi:hypothetical protein
VKVFLDECGFAAFVIIDRNLSFRQRLEAFSIVVIVLRVRTNRLAELWPLVPGLLKAPELPRAGLAPFIEAD